MRVGAGALALLVLAGTFRALTFSATTSSPPDGGRMTAVASAAAASVPGTSMVRIETESADTWQVTLADIDGRCWQVRVAAVGDVIGALPPPAIVACPPTVSVDPDPGAEAEPGSDVDLVARGFVESYLTASPAVQRYLAPDISMELPLPVRTVTVDVVRSRKTTDGGQVASVNATADGAAVGYRLRLVELEGRLWVEGLYAGPYIGTLTTQPGNPVVAGSSPDGLAAVGGSTTTTSAGANAFSSSTTAPGDGTATTLAPRPTLPPETSTTRPVGPGE